MRRDRVVLAAVILTLALGGPALAGPVKEQYPGSTISFDGGVGKKGKATGKYGPSRELKYAFDNNFRLSTLPERPVDVGNPMTSTQVDFQNVLAKAFPKYTFNYFAADGKTDLSLAANSLVVKTYDVDIDAIAEDFYVAYTGAKPTGGDVHWIQVIKDNWSKDGLPYSTDNLVDNGGESLPFYDTKGVATGAFGSPDSAFLYDQPSRKSLDLPGNWNGTPIFWTAETYIAQLIGPNDKGGQIVNIYDGVRWGWTINKITAPEPEGWVLLVAGAGLAGAALRRQRRRARICWATMVSRQRSQMPPWP
jgi:hypothetical protein